MKKLLTFVLLLFSLEFLYSNEDISSQIEAINKSTNVVSVPEISIPVIELNILDINDIKTDNIVFTYYLVGTITLSDILHATYFTSLGTNLNASYFTQLGYDIDVLLNPIDVSHEWTKIYETSIKPMSEYYEAKYDLLGECGEYQPDTMSYYGYWWIELQQKQNEEGFTDEIRKEWIKLFKEMKPYVKR